MTELKGKLKIIGLMKIDGDYEIGAFVACDQDELKNGIELFGEEVIIIPKEERGE